MPYASTAELPKQIRDAIPSNVGRRMFMRVVNSQLDRGLSESRAFASAWSALRSAGYQKQPDGTYVRKQDMPASTREALQNKVRQHNERYGDTESKKATLSMLQAVYRRGVGAYRTNPESVRPNVSSPEQWAMGRVNDFLRILSGSRTTRLYDQDLLPASHPKHSSKQTKMTPSASSVHVDGPINDELEKETYTPPKAAQNAARRVLRWKEQHGDEVKGMTSVGWARARQLASGKPVSRETVARMAQFARHRQNAKIDPKYRGTPWKDRGYVAWLGWGSDSGVNWAQRTMDRINKRQVGDDQFTNPDEARARAYDLGLGDAIHVHDTPDGAFYMPGESHEDYVEQMREAAGIPEEEEDIDDDTLERAIGAIMSSILSKSFVSTADVVKADEEQRIVYGWASVISENGKPVIDKQGHIIKAEDMEKMAHDFMMSARTAKAMHSGSSVGEIIHSLPVTKALAEAFGMSPDKEGWIIGVKVRDDNIWQRVKDGTFKAFSIGGKGRLRDA